MNNRNIIIGAALAGVVLAGAILAVACSSQETPEKIDLSTIHTTAAETLAPETSSQETAETGEESTEAESSSAQSISYEIAAYTEGDSISIEYPVISGMSDPSSQEKANQLLKDNALSILKAWDTESGGCTIEIQCQVPALSQKRITVLYTGYASQEGAAHPVNQFYTNTVDLSSCKDMGLSDFADPYTMAGYVLSDDVEFDGVNGDQLTALLEERSAMDIESYTDIFENADFPFDAENYWPSTFSYEKQGEIYFSIPVSHSLGDYAIVKFTPETK